MHVMAFLPVLIHVMTLLSGAGKAVRVTCCVCCLSAVSHSFGYGLMDASAMVELALNWTHVPKQHKCEIRSTDSPR